MKHGVKSQLNYVWVLLMFLLVGGAVHSQDAEPRRVALVVGNGGYEVGELGNPPNDAQDVAAELEKLGFEVQLRIDRTLDEMDRDLREFRSSLEPGDVAMFFYAGHGVQVDGENFLLPVDNGGIVDQDQLRRKAISSQEYVDYMAEAGSKLNLVILDACRDNPLPSTSRGGSRGLSVMATPGGSTNVVVYATQAGQVAADGDGRNSPFTAAFLQELPKPDVNLLTMLNNVGNTVRSATGGVQVPMVRNDPLSEPFFFASSAKLVAQADAASREAQEALATIEAEIARQQELLASAQNESARQAAEVELQRQRALEAAQRIEAENRAAEAARLAEQARLLREQEQQAALIAAESQQQQAELARLAEERRRELEALREGAVTNDPNVLAETLLIIERNLETIEDQYEAVAAQTEASIRGSYNSQFASFETASPRGFETDAEFRSRIAGERRELEASVAAEVEVRLADIMREQESQTSELERQRSQARASIDDQEWTLAGSEVAVVPGEYDRNTRRWSFTVTSRSPQIEWSREISTTLPEELDARGAAFDAIDQAIGAGALSGQIAWRLGRRGSGSETGFALRVHEARIHNLAADDAVVASWSSTGGSSAGAFVPSATAKLGWLPAETEVSVRSAAGESRSWTTSANGEFAFPEPVPVGSYRVELTGPYLRRVELRDLPVSAIRPLEVEPEIELLGKQQVRNSSDTEIRFAIFARTSETTSPSARARGELSMGSSTALSLEPGDYILLYGRANEKEFSEEIEIALAAVSTNEISIESVDYSVASRIVSQQTVVTGLEQDFALIAPQAGTLRGLGWGGIGLGVAGIGAGVTTFFLGQEAYDSYLATPYTDIAGQYRQEAAQMSQISSASFIAGGVTLLAGLIFQLIAPDTSSAEASVERERAVLQELQREHDALPEYFREVR